MVFDLDLFVDETKLCKYLSETNLKKLCHLVTDILIEEPNVQSISTPVTVCGDIHGQYYDLEELFKKSGQIPENKYIFLGDFVDRGYYSLETITKLLVLKARYPDKISLLRGNHESRQTTKIYGFYDECLTKYGNPNPWKYITNLFDFLPIAAVIENQILCIHGGLSPSIKTIDQIRTIKRVQEIPQKGPFCDLVWSDPNDPGGYGESGFSTAQDLDGFGGSDTDNTNAFDTYSPSAQNWSLSPRGAGWLFGKRVTLEFINNNNLTLICRAHQLVNEGYKYIFDNTLVTIWSAPNYCYRCGNMAAVIKFDTDGSQTPLIFEAVPDKDRDIPKQRAFQYFL